MIIRLGNYWADLGKPLDLSLPLDPKLRGVNCFYAPEFAAQPVRAGDFIGSVAEGGPVNFKNVALNPHGNGTHTECVGHITAEPFTINQCLKQFMWIAELISVKPEKKSTDFIIGEHQVREALGNTDSKAVIIRTLPNNSQKRIRNYSGTNPPYLSQKAAKYLADSGVLHLLIDLPSVDREEDAGALAAHKAFWQYPNEVRTSATITELIYVPDEIKDGRYLLNMQIASFEIDASPSKPVIYRLYSNEI